MFMPNLGQHESPTIALDDKTAAWIRIDAAKRGMSVSRFVSELLNQRMPHPRSYNEAMRNYFAQKPFKFEYIDGRRPTREELHARTRLR